MSVRVLQSLCLCLTVCVCVVFVSGSLRLCLALGVCAWQAVGTCAWQSACFCDVMNKPIGWDLSVKYATSQPVCSSLVLSETIWLYLEFIFDGKSTSVVYTFIKTLCEPENGNIYTLSVFRPPFFFSWCPLKLDDQDQNSNRTTNIPDSKHRFMTSFLQPLPYLVLRWGPENCQLMSNFCWYSNSSKFVANNSDYQTFVLQRTMLLTSAQKKNKIV